MTHILASSSLVFMMSCYCCCGLVSSRSCYDSLLAGLSAQRLYASAAGSGKTSLINALAGRLQASKGAVLSGAIHINGQDRRTSSANITACAFCLAPMTGPHASKLF